MSRMPQQPSLSVAETLQLRKDMQFLRNTLAETSRRAHESHVKIARARHMLLGFRIQCGQLPEGDPVRQAFETFIKTLDEVLL